MTICHQLKRKTALWECEDYLSSEKIYIYLQESLGQWLLIVQRDTGYGLSKKNLKEENGRVHASFDLDREIYDDYLNGRITKTICEAKNLNKLLQAREMALNLGLVENQDFGMINDACLTELIPEWVDENGEGRCTVGIWFKPLQDDVAHCISKKFQLYKD
ncbi:MAG: peptidyl-tRNA hydrolase [Treponema sp.]|uniref:peptidyl-tRNA hydrolase n=1 Tax=Treponema sp. TaxID=166 RepID=UPI002A917EE9|nr:peptidyl-tRNA hydrolase [Treponema sp.]MDY6397708.1 peptidyl-tRNA hydrolase [Treponema sp.]